MKNTVGNKSLKAFTLIEILLVTVAIILLAGIVIFAVNPTKQYSETRNTQRRVDAKQIINAIYEYNVSKNGVFPPNILSASDCSHSLLEICKTNAVDCEGFTDLSTYLVGEKSDFLKSIPTDPSASSLNGSGYSVYRDMNTDHIIVCAPHAESGQIISATR